MFHLDFLDLLLDLLSKILAKFKDYFINSITSDMIMKETEVLSSYSKKGGGLKLVLQIDEK